MFTLEQIKQRHSKVKSGADFPKYIRDLRVLGVNNYITYVADGHVEYFGDANFHLKSDPKYSIINVSEKNENDKFKDYLKTHQQGKSDYLTFCKQAAETGIEKWVVLLNEMTCTYYDKKGNQVLVENVPQ